MTTEQLLLSAGFSKRESKKPKVVSVHQTCITYCEIYERITDSRKEVLTLQTVQKLPFQEDGERASCNVPQEAEKTSSLPSLDVCPYRKIVANQKLPSSHKSEHSKRVLRLLRNKFIGSVLGAISLEESLAKIDSELIRDLAINQSLLEELPRALLEEFLLEADYAVFFIDILGPLGERTFFVSRASSFSLSPIYSFQLQEVAS